MRTTRFERTDGKDHWFLSAAGPARNERVFAAGKTVRLEVADEVHFKAVVRRKHGKMQLGFSIRTPDHNGLSVYKNDKRVPVTYKLFSAKGKEIGSGAMNYG